MSQQTLMQLREMRLNGFIDALRHQQESTHYNGLSFDERLSFLVNQEYLDRQNRKLKRSLDKAQLKQNATIEDVDFETPRKLNRAAFLELAAGTWVSQKHNLLIIGPTGIGKSFLSCALADKVCRMGFQSRYYRTNTFLSELLLAKADGSYPKLTRQLSKTHLLVMDEWLRDPLTTVQAREILDILDDRYRKASTLFCSQVPVKEWHARIEDSSIADAILDRIVHDSLRLELDGNSMRKKTSAISNNKASLRSDNLEK